MIEENKLSATEDLSEEQKLELLQDVKQLRKTLKRLGKNQLITLVLQQMNLAIEHQNINKLLLEELKKLTEGKDNENS